MRVSIFRKINDPGGPVLTLTVDGQAVTAQPGETVATVLLRQPTPASRSTPVQGSPRAPFCMMGVGFDCLATVDGAASTQSCLVTVREGMRVERQFGRQSVTPWCAPGRCSWRWVRRIGQHRFRAGPFHMTLALDCVHSGNAPQAYLAPDLNEWG